jgi:hypothetical protein
MQFSLQRWIEVFKSIVVEGGVDMQQQDLGAKVAGQECRLLHYPARLLGQLDGHEDFMPLQLRRLSLHK